MTGHIRKKKIKNGHIWQVIVELGSDESGKRKRIYRNIRGQKQEAQKLLASLLTELSNGTYIEPSKITLKEYFLDWMETYVKMNLSPTTIDSYRINIEKHVIPTLGHIKLQELKPMDLQKFYKMKLENGRTDGKGGLSARSVRYIHRNIHEALEHAVRMQLIPRNVAALVTLPKAKPYKANVYNEKQLLILLEKAMGTDMELAIFLTATLGLRRGELLGLKWSDVDFETGRIRIQNNLVQTQKGSVCKEPKSKSSSRGLDLPEGLVAILKKHHKIQAQNKLKLGAAYDKRDFICCQNNGYPFSPGYYSKKFKTFLEENGLPHIRLHDLRHSNATLMLMYGIQPKVASSSLGHSSIGITLDLYSHVLPEMQKEVADKIESGIFKKLSNGVVGSKAK